MTPPWQSPDLERSERPRPDRARRAKEATYRFKTAIAGDLPGYEAAVEGWPEGGGGRPGQAVRPCHPGRRAAAIRDGAISAPDPPGSGDSRYPGDRSGHVRWPPVSRIIALRFPGGLDQWSVRPGSPLRFGRDDKRQTLNRRGPPKLYDGQATAKKGQLVAAPEWWKWTRRTFTNDLGGS